jgi:hypothetical protein
MKKNITRYALSICVGAALLVNVSSCKKDDGESATQRTQRLLTSHTWQLSKLTVAGIDQTSLYPSMTLTASQNVYTATNGEPVWPSSGTWELVDQATIDRDNGEIITIEELTENTLTLSMHWSETTYGPGRTKSVEGAHVFEFVK